MTLDRIVVVVRARDRRTAALVLERARRRGFRAFASSGSEQPHRREGETWFAVEPTKIRSLSPSGRPHGEVTIRSISGPADLEVVLRQAHRSETLAVRWMGERIIPLETLIARRHAGTSIWVLVRGLSEVAGALGALERGADRVFVEVRTPEEVEALERLLGLVPALDLNWSTASVVRVAPGGQAERILVDTSSLLGPDEGLLVGSSASLLFHVASEALGSRYTRPRPFRVNAGAPHSYVLMADGTTRYLAELEVGDPVLITSPDGGQRSATVGRLKIETRPMVLLEARTRRRSGTLFLQEAETVRVSAVRGPVAITDVRIGLRLRAVELAPARHLGTVIDETVVER